jgi:hypothetical protein
VPNRDDPVVFQISGRDSSCSECKGPLAPGSLLRKEGERGLCVDCADLSHLFFLGAGDACVTRRASRYSAVRFVVLRWSRSRKHYERQGILVQEAAVRRAEEECEADAGQREGRRMRDELRRTKLDSAYVEAFARATRERYPNAAEGTERAIAEHACERHSARIGRTAAAKDFDPRAIDLAVQAHVRHVHTRYDELLAGGSDRDDARMAVSADVDRILEEWRR